VLCGSQNIVLNGKNIVQSEAIIRGDLANVRVGRHCIISSKAVIRPPFKKFSKGYVSPSHPCFWGHQTFLFKISNLRNHFYFNSSEGRIISHIKGLPQKLSYYYRALISTIFLNDDFWKLSDKRPYFNYFSM
jgi:hypothetical protein